MSLQKIPILTITFNNPLPWSDVPKFRGAVINMLNSKNILFHNHQADGSLRYSYPLIQYKRIHGKAAIICIGEGTESIGDFFSNIHETIQIGQQGTILELDAVKADKILIQVWGSDFSYSLRKWLPFNQENYAKYHKIDDLKGKVQFLEKILIGNILSFAKGLNIHLEQEVRCGITAMEEIGGLKYKWVSFASFDVMFKCNVSLPNFIGLGKSVSHGFGMCVCLNQN